MDEIIDACERSCFEKIQLLISQRNTDINDYTLKWACEHGYYDLTKYILSSGQYNNVDDVLQIACQFNHQSIIILLLESGISIGIQFNSKLLDWAINYNHIDLIKLLLSLGTKNKTSLKIACRKGCFEIIYL